MSPRERFEGEFWNSTTVLPVDPALGDPLTGPVSKLFRQPEVGLSAKWNHYFHVYDRFLGPHAGRDLRVLEIGIGRGGSLDMWRRFFGPGAVIVGIDIRPATAAFERENVHVRIGSQTDTDFLAAVVDEFGPFDVILDDGGHLVSQQIVSFGALYPTLALDPGLYIVEDLHSNYWPELIDERPTFIELMHELVHELHEPYSQVTSAFSTLFTGAETDDRRLADGPLDAGPQVVTSTFAAWTRAISFFDSMVVIEKAERMLPTHESLTD